MINVLLTCTIILMIVSIVALSFLLKKFINKTIYAYRNILTVAAIIYISIMFVVLVGYIFVRHLNDTQITIRSFFEFAADFPRAFSYFAIPVFLIICLAIFVSNLALIRHEGFRTTNLMSAVLGICYIGGTGLLYLVSYCIQKYLLLPNGITNGHPLIIVFTYSELFLMMLISYFECILIASFIMGYVAVKHVPSHDKDFIIILGCLISKEGGLLPLLKARTNRAIKFAWEQEIDTGKKLRFVPSGGKGHNEVIAEGSAIELYLLSHSAEFYEVFTEKHSKNTYENMLFSKKIIDDVNPDAKIAFATTNYHILRSGILARRAGFDAEGIASKTKWYFWPNGFIREFFGILAINKKAHILTISACALVNIILGIIDFIN